MTDLYDVAVIGGGPSGLSTALNAASEGLTTILLVSDLGGQAGTSSNIETYLGFPEGISGPELTDLAATQARKFGTRISFCEVESVSRNADGHFVLVTKGNEIIRARSVVVATGARYNRLPATTGCHEFEGNGVHFACTASDIRRCRCEEVVVVGGGNSAGQAAMFLSDRAKHVHLVIRREDLRSSMSAYLIDRIEACSNVTPHPRTEVHRIGGDGKVEWVQLRSLDTGDIEQRPITDVFVMIGATPNTRFLTGMCSLDDKGFVVTDDHKATTTPGLYAVGDVRAGSVKRVANAVGEGGSVVQWLWRFLFPPAAEPVTL
jgi:thioredoxin reductase (NADPH)